MCFLLMHMLPGDPATIMLGETATKAQITDLRHELWLDRPLIAQYVHWVDNAFHGNFGKSIISHEYVKKQIFDALPVTLYLASIALILSTILGILAGIYCAVKRGSILDSIISVLSNAGLAVPTFWLGILCIYFFGLKLGWLPVQGYVSPTDNLGESLQKAIMPVICLSINNIAVFARQTRSSMLEVINQDYIRTAKAKGLKKRVVVFRHALKNALIPTVTMLGLQLRSLVGGSVLVETVFSIPGMGQLIVNSAFNRDYLVVQAGVLLIAIVVCFANLIVDISYSWLDPRVRYD
jgi:peptide/nickel transport system permease protein